MEKHEIRGAAAWRGLIAIAALVAIIAGMRAASDLIVPFLLALSIAIICLPPLYWMRQHRVPTWIAITVLIVIIVAGIIGVGALIANSIGNFVQDLPSYQDRLQGILQETMKFAHRLGWDVSLESLRHQLNPNNAFALVTRFFKSFGAVLTDGFLIVFTVLFLLFEATVLPRKFEVIPKTEREHRSLAVFVSFVESVQRYVFLKTVLSLVLGFLVTLVLWGLGVRYAPLWGLLAFLLNFVPNIGAFLSAIPPILLALLQGGWPLFGYTAGTLFTIHFVTGNFVEPVLMGGRLGLSTLVVFVSLIFWGWVLGPVGMLLSVPLTMIIRIGFESYPDTHWLAVLLGPPPAPERERRLVALWRSWLERVLGVRLKTRPRDRF